MYQLIKNNKQITFALGLFLIASNVFVFYFIRQEHYIYFWDFATYFDKYVYLREHIFNETIKAIETVFWSIREDEYNYFPSLLLTPFSMLFGTSRLAYISAIANTFAFPAAITFILLTQRLAVKQQRRTAYLPLIMVGLIILSPDIWNPILKGFVGIGGVVLTNFIYYLYLQCDFSEQKKRHLFLIAAFIPVLVIFRRWYAYWGAAFYITLLLELSIISIRIWSKNNEKVLMDMGKYALMGFISAVIFFGLTPTYGKQILGTNYSDIYSFSKFSTNFLQSFLYVLNSFGLLYFTLFVLGCIDAAINKETRKFTVFVLCQTIIVFLMFAKIQDFASHQRYMLLPQVLIFAVLFINKIICKATRTNVILVGILMLLIASNFLIAFGSQKSVKKLGYPSLFTNIRHQPYNRSDLIEIERMLATFEQIAKVSSDRIYVLSASDILNSHIMTSASIYFHKYKNVSSMFLESSELDKRDGFPTFLLKADYVLVAEPVQFLMKAEDQRVLIVPTELFQENKGIARSFEKMSYEFNLDNNVKVFIYRKVKPLISSDINQLSESLRYYYPNRPNIFSPKEL